MGVATEVKCHHVPHQHIFYDMQAAAFRGRLRCTCGKIDRISRWIAITHEQAEHQVAYLQLKDTLKTSFYEKTNPPPSGEAPDI